MLYYFSKDCINWGLMPPATKEVKEKAKLAKGRFTGDPSHEFEHVEIKNVPGEGDEIHEEEETVIIGLFKCIITFISVYIYIYIYISLDIDI